MWSMLGNSEGRLELSTHTTRRREDLTTGVFHASEDPVAQFEGMNGYSGIKTAAGKHGV